MSENPLFHVVVVVVADDPDTGRLLVRWLTSAGHEAVLAPDLVQARQALVSSTPEVVLVDLDLRDHKGLELLEEIELQRSMQPIVLLDQGTQVQDVVQALRGRALDTLVKPLERASLLAAVERASRSRLPRRLLSPLVSPEGASWHGIVGESDAILRTRAQIERIAASDVTVVIGGETGTGKELVARAIHRASPRARHPFVAVNCGAIPQGLQESELFGHEKGSFTGAAGRRAGRFEQANGGIIFLDEVAELTPPLQVALLRVLQERSFYRVGGTEEVHVDVRVIAATHRVLEDEANAGRFRLDLFYRLAVYELDVPPLRERSGDILTLARHFLRTLGGGRELRLSPEAAAAIEAYRWPGNVRELQNAMQGASVLAQDLVGPEHLPPRVVRCAEEQGRHPASDSSRLFGRAHVVDAEEKEALLAALRSANGNVSRAMSLLGVPRTTMYRKLRKHGILATGPAA